MEYLATLAHALISPVNCVGNYADSLLQVTGHFISCVGGNLAGIAQATGGVADGAVNAVASIGA